MLCHDGGPINFLNNPSYTCSKSVLWRPEVEGRFFNPVDSSSSTSIPIRPTSGIESIPKQPDHHDPIFQLLQTVSFTAIYETSFPRIKDGLCPGFLDYTKHHSPKTCLEVVFPIIPQYFIVHQDEQPISDVSALEIDPEDVELISRVEPRCLYRATDQSSCIPGKVRYYCASWVSFSLLLLSATDPNKINQAHPCHRHDRAQRPVACHLCELGRLFPVCCRKTE